jgi:cell volume regulation protein A
MFMNVIDVLNTIILLAGILVLLGIVSSKFSARLGVPVLVLFLLVGMLAGSEGIGRIEFEDHSIAYGVGTLALAIILFDGGLSTSYASIRTALKPAMSLATIGVLITSLVTGLAAAWVLNISWLQGLLLGSIVGSTDAAAVFAVLRHGGVHLSDRLASTLEIESASNDPMAIFLTVGCIEVLTQRMELGGELAMLFVMQMGIGAIVGLAIGYSAVWATNRINLDAAGLYPVLVTACGLLTFGLAATLGGSGFLAIYIAGVVIGNSRIVFQRGIFLFHDAGAWLGQIVMFTVLGLLCFPSQLVGVAGQGLLIAALLMFVARPIAVLASVMFFGFNLRELTFISWVGLKGAVPITLATFPFLMGVDEPTAALLFNVVFFVVVISALVQGWTLPIVAQWLGLVQPGQPEPPVTLEMSSLRHVEGDIVDYTIDEDSQVAGKLVKNIALPDGVVIAIIARERQIIPPQGSTRILPGDHAILVLKTGTRAMVDRVFSHKQTTHDALPTQLEFPLRASTTVGELEEFYGIQLNVPREATLAEAVVARCDDQPISTATRVVFGSIALRVLECDDAGNIATVGMQVLPVEL